MRSLVRAAALLAGHALGAGAQQLPDTLFRPAIARPAFASERGPRLCLDEAHHNFHTLDNRFWAFGALARRDGLRVAPLRAEFTARTLAACDLLVISNAQPSADAWSEYPYPTPSAFSDSEIAAVKRWVEGGGRLLLIADHMPLAGAATKLAAVFGARFTDGFAYTAAIRRADSTYNSQAGAVPTLFRPSDRTLADHAIVRGRDSTERVTQVRSFTGQAFEWTSPDVQPVMVLPPDFISIEPRIAWQFEKTSAIREVGGWYQGATRAVGRGRVALFGEAAMFSAQVTGPNRNPMGMNAPGAEQNAQFALNVLRWLVGVIER